MKKKVYLLVILVAMVTCGLILTTDTTFASADSITGEFQSVVTAEYKANYEKSINAYKDIIADFQKPSAYFLDTKTDFLDWDACDDNFAGVYFDEYGCLNVCTVSSNYINEKYEGQIINRIHKYPYSYLRSIQKEIEKVMLEKGVISVGINVTDNIINISIEGDNKKEIVEFIQSKGHLEDTLNISIESRAQQISSTVYGGSTITATKTTGVTTGTVGANVVDNKTGEFGVLTAGHVVSDKLDGENEFATINYYGSLVGADGEYQIGGKIDAGIVIFDNQKSWQVTTKNTLDNDVYLGSEAIIIPGTPVTTLGATTGKLIGTILETNATFTDSVKAIPVYNCFTISNFNKGGDSGGPVYIPGFDGYYLIGILTGELHTIPEGEHIKTYATRISNITEALDITIITSDNIDQFKDIYFESYSNGAVITGISSIATSVTIPKTINNQPVIGIDEDAAIDNNIIETINLNDVEIVSRRAFKNCTNLKTVIAPNVNFIGSEVFDGCINLENLNLGNKLEELYRAAFRDCKKLKSFNLGNIKEIPESTFQGSGLTDITIPNTVAIIGNSAFAGCTNLGSGGNAMYLPNSVTSIGDYAFSNCSSLKSIAIPGRVTSIREGTFSGCTSLISITLPNSVTSIGNYAFSNCSSLKNIAIPGRVTSIREGTFSGCTSLTDITLPGGITNIWDSAFSGCTSLTSITLPDSIERIRSSAFFNTGIWNTAQNGSIVYAGKWAVGVKGSITGQAALRPDTAGIADNTLYSANIKNITIPASVKYIGTNGLPSGIESIVLERPSSQGITLLYGAGIYNSLSSIHVPDFASVSAYGNANDWIKYSAYITTRYSQPDWVLYDDWNDECGECHGCIYYGECEYNWYSEFYNSCENMCGECEECGYFRYYYKLTLELPYTGNIKLDLDFYYSMYGIWWSGEAELIVDNQTNELFVFWTEQGSTGLFIVTAVNNGNGSVSLMIETRQIDYGYLFHVKIYIEA